jgi:MFS family permease
MGPMSPSGANLLEEIATTSGQLIAARCLMGLGAAMVFPATLSLLTNAFTNRAERAQAGRRGLRPVDGRHGAHRLHDHRGANHGWSSARSLAGFALGLALLSVFVAWERRSEHPMLDVSLFRNPRFSAASGAVTVSFFTLFGFIFVITQYFQFIRSYTPLSAGVHLLPVAGGVAVASVVGTKVAVPLGTKLVVATGLVMVAGFYVWVSTSSATTAYATIAARWWCTASAWA